MITGKRPRSINDYDIDTPEPEQKAQKHEEPLSYTAELNERVLKKIKRRLRENPDIDLTTVIPSEYLERYAEGRKLDGLQETVTEYSEPKCTIFESSPTKELDQTNATPIDNLSQSRNDFDIPFALAPNVEQLLNCGCNDQDAMERRLQDLIRSGEIIWRSEVSSDLVVVKCNDDIVLKVIPSTSDHTEATTMRFLQDSMSEIPAPRLLGMVSCHFRTYVFMTYIPGTRLDSIWCQLDETQKRGIATELEVILQNMRQQAPLGTPLGGVASEGCKDTRRYTRTCERTLSTIPEFIDFLFSNPHFGGEVYTRLLRDMWTDQQSSVVFTHGDLEPMNILVRSCDNGSYQVSGLIDWEMSGWYPDWWESIKATNCLSTMTSKNDWALYLLTCISSRKHKVSWLLDRLWDAHVT